MKGRTAKLLRKGAKRYKLPYKDLKRAYNNLNSEEKNQFLVDARRMDYVV